MNIFTRNTTIVFLLMSIAIFAQAPDFNWSKQFKSTGKDFGNAITVAPNGDVYVTGEFQKTLTLSDDINLVSAGTVGDIEFFLARLDANGNPVWGKKGGGSLTDRGYGVKIDPNGDIIVTGHFYGTAVFETETLTSAGNLDVFVAKYDSLGALKWIKQGKDAQQSSTRDIAIDPSGNIILVGYFGSSKAYDTLSYEGTVIAGHLQRDGFILKLDNNGNPIWGINIGGDEPDEEIRAVDIDAAGNIYVAGNCSVGAEFNGTIPENNGGRDLFIAKYTSDGILSWVKTAGGLLNDDASGISLDGKGNLYVCGYIDSAGTFMGNQFVAEGDLDTYIAKLDTSGNLQWFKTGGGINDDYATDVRYSDKGVYMSGYYKLTYTAEDKSITSAGAEDIFVAAYIEDGSINWIKTAGGSGLDKLIGSATDAAGNLYNIGYFSGTTELDSTSYVSSGAEDIYVYRMGNLIVPVELTSFSASAAREGVKLSWITATETNNSGFRIERRSENFSWENVGFVEGKGTTSSKTIYSYTDKVTAPGKYSYRLKQVDFDGTYEYSNTIEINTAIPSEFEVFQNYPNPFNPVTNIKFNLPQDANVKITLVNMLGEESVLLQNNFTAGANQVAFNASGFASGTYVYVVRATGTDGTVMTSSKKLTLIK